MEDEIIIETVTEKVKISELSDREKIIYDYGYEKGSGDKRVRLVQSLICFIFILLLVISFLKSCAY